MNLQENKDYTLVPHTGHPDAWAVRLETGDYIETTIIFGSVRYDDVKEALTFDFEILETPDEMLTEDDEGLQTHAGMVLLSIIETGLEEGFVQTEGRESGDEFTN